MIIIIIKQIKIIYEMMWHKMNTPTVSVVLTVRACGGAVTATHGGKRRCHWKIFPGLLAA